VIRFRRSAVLLAALWIIAGAAAAHPGTGIVVDAAGRVFFTDLTGIWRIDPDGTVRVVVPGKHCHTLALAPDGSVSGEHVSYDGSKFWTSAWTLRPDGSVIQTAAPEAGFPLVFTPTIAADRTRYFYRVDNHRKDRSEIFRQQPGGRLEWFAGGAYGFADGPRQTARFGSIGAMAAGGDGALYLTDAPAVRRVGPDGRVTTIARGGPLLESTVAGRVLGGAFGGLMGIVRDESGGLYVANFGGRRVVRVGPGGTVVSVLPSETPWSPSGVTLRGGHLYVLEAGAWPGFFDAVRVRRMRPDRSVSVLAVIRGGRQSR
jgi:hypothetical protein